MDTRWGITLRQILQELRRMCKTCNQLLPSHARQQPVSELAKCFFMDRLLGHPVVDHSGAVVQFIGTTMDLTERKHAEETLQRAQAELAYATRVMTLGEMTASIAHEVNQPLAAIVTNSEAWVRLLARARRHP